MKTGIFGWTVVLMTNHIDTKSIDVGWYDDGQMRMCIERKGGKRHAEYEYWNRGDTLWSHKIYENNNLVKEMV